MLRFKNNLKLKFALILLGVILSLVVLEVTLRMAGYLYNSAFRSKTLGNKEGVVRIFCIGESTTWGVGAKDPLTQSYPRQLESMLLNKYPDSDIKVFYDQMIGQNTEEIALKLPLYIKKYQPQIIILMAGINNWWNLDRNKFLFGKSKFFLNTLIFLDRFRVWKLLKYTWLSLGLYKERWNYFFPKDETPDSLEKKIERIYGSDYFNVMNKIAEHDLREMVEICKKTHIDVILCSYPMDTNNLYNIIKKIAREQQTYFVDIFSRFQSLPQDEIRHYLWKDGWHPNERGYAIVAKEIYNTIVKNQLVEKLIK